VSDPSQDDPTIGDGVALWRRIGPSWVIKDSNLGRLRPTSQAFQNQRGGEAFSIHISTDAAAIGLGPQDLVAGLTGFGMAEFGAGLARELRQGVVRVPEEGEIGHGHVVGKKSKSVREQFAKQSVLIIPPEPAGEDLP
jgi:hypothetical protein